MPIAKIKCVKVRVNKSKESLIVDVRRQPGLKELPKPKKPQSIRIQWRSVKERLKSMHTAERVQTLVDAGIITPKGRLTKPYRNLRF